MKVPLRAPTKVLFGFIVILLVLAVIFTVSAQVALNTTWGHDQVRRLVVTELSESIPGTIRVERIDDIETLHGINTARVFATGVRIASPDGADVIVAKKAELDFGLIAFFNESIEFDRARVEGGEVIVKWGADGDTGIERTFGSPGESTGRRKNLDLRSMHVQDVTVVVEPYREPPMRFENVTGFVRVVRPPEKKSVELQLESVEATLAKPKVLGKNIRFSAVDGRIGGGHDETVDVKFRGSFGKGRLEGTIAVNPKREKPTHIFVDVDGSVRARLAAMAANVRSELGGKMEIEVD